MTPVFTPIHVFSGGFADGGRCLVGAPLLRGHKVFVTAGGATALPNGGAVCGYDESAGFFINDALDSGDITQGLQPQGNIGYANTNPPILFFTTATGGQGAGNGLGTLHCSNASIEGTIGITGGGASDTLLIKFDGTTQGSNPYGCVYDPITMAVYGTCRAGGANGGGTLWKYDMTTVGVGNTSGVFSVLVNFDNPANNIGLHGWNPNGVILHGGVLWGTTYGGGEGSETGILYSVNTDGTGFADQWEFGGGPYGAHPAGNILFNGGLIYGCCNQQGNVSGTGKGNVWAFNPTTRRFSELYVFTGQADGANPTAGVAFGSDGNLYGCCSSGGIPNAFSGNGVAWQLTAASGFAALVTIYEFTNTQIGITGMGDGYSPQIELTESNQFPGTFYGCSSQGGYSGNDGVFFSLKVF